MPKGRPRTCCGRYLGRGRAKRGMFEGDLEEGELEIGQVSSQIGAVLPAARIVAEIIGEYRALLDTLKDGRSERFEFDGDLEQ